MKFLAYHVKGLAMGSIRGFWGIIGYNQSLASEVQFDCADERVPFLLSYHCFLSVYVGLSFYRSYWEVWGSFSLLQASYMFDFKNQSGGFCLGLCCRVLWIRLRTRGCWCSKRRCVFVKATIVFVVSSARPCQRCAFLAFPFVKMLRETTDTGKIRDRISAFCLCMYNADIYSGYPSMVLLVLKY